MISNDNMRATDAITVRAVISSAHVKDLARLKAAYPVTVVFDSPLEKLFEVSTTVPRHDQVEAAAAAMGQTIEACGWDREWIYIGFGNAPATGGYELLCD